MMRERYQPIGGSWFCENGWKWISGGSGLETEQYTVGHIYSEHDVSENA